VRHFLRFSILRPDTFGRTQEIGISSAFIYSEQKDAQILQDSACGIYRVVFTCVEMLEGPSFTKVLHSEMFQRHLLAIYIDECHLVHEASSWRTAYMCLLLLQTLVGHDIPLITISATMPSMYRESLHQYAGVNTIM
jgi:superfamily II DNA helicase RecQ